MDTKNLFTEKDVIDLFKITSANIKELEERGEVKPIMHNGERYYIPSEFATAVGLQRKANKGAVRAEYR